MSKPRPSRRTGGKHATRRADAGRRTPARNAGRRAEASTPPTRAPGARPAPATSTVTPVGPFRLGAIPGVTPGAWIDAWRERMPRHPLQLIPLDVATQRDALDADDVDMALVRLPIDGDGLHVIRLYDETPVVIVGVDDALTAVDTLTAADLDGQVMIIPRDDVLGFTAPGTVTPSFAPPQTTKDAVELAAAGIGIVVTPMSLARLHHRKDVTYRPLADGPVSTVALAWTAERTSPLTDMFVGIVRGRTARSSR